MAVAVALAVAVAVMMAAVAGISSAQGAVLPPRTAAVATVTPVATAMVGAQTTINNQRRYWQWKNNDSNNDNN